MNAVIIDDEKKTRDFIESIIKKFFPEIKILEKASSVKEGITAISIYSPDIVFLDIEMQDGTGFNVLEAITERNFELVFITAYNQYAIKAFKYSAIDYLVKPIDIDDFICSIKRVKSKRNKVINQLINFQVLKENIEKKSPTKLVIPSSKGFEYIKLKDIIRFEADGRYTNIYLINNKKITVSKMLKEFIDYVDEKYFYRTHKSHLINLHFVKMYVKTEGGHIIMKDESQVAIAREKKAEFLKIMENFNLI